MKQYHQKIASFLAMTDITKSPTRRVTPTKKVGRPKKLLKKQEEF